MKKCLLEDITVLVSGTWDCHLMWQESGRRRHVSEASEMGDFLMVQRVLPPTPRIFISRRQREIWHKEREAAMCLGWEAETGVAQPPEAGRDNEETVP